MYLARTAVKPTTFRDLITAGDTVAQARSCSAFWHAIADGP